MTDDNLDITSDPSDMWLVYDDDGTLHAQHWRDIETAGPLINEYGNDMMLIGWTTLPPEVSE